MVTPQFCLSKFTFQMFSKMFVGGLSWQTTEGKKIIDLDKVIRADYHNLTESMKEYFCKFGAVVEAMVMRDPSTKHSR